MAVHGVQKSTVSICGRLFHHGNSNKAHPTSRSPPSLPPRRRTCTPMPTTSSLQRLAKREDRQEMRVFKGERTQAITHPG
jgi:hypothetical protein